MKIFFLQKQKKHFHLINESVKNNPFNALCLFADLTFLDKSLAYISFKIFLNGAISLLSINVSTPSLTAIYLTLCKGKYCSV